MDVILASPPCEGFSVASIGRHWNHDNTPKTHKAAYSMEIVRKTLEVIKLYQPRFFVIENPRGKLRKLDFMNQEWLERRTVTYCQYGDRRMKPTDLWGGFPPSLELKPVCKNGMPCHVAAPRQSSTGSQGMPADVSAKIPRELSLAVCLAAEEDMKEERKPRVPVPDPQGVLL